MIFKDYYKILNLETNKVTINEIKIAYKKQKKKYHPDVNVGNKNCEERFKDINEAYKILSEPTSKKRYDRIWNRNIGNKNSSYQYTPKGDFFTIFFGNVAEEKTEKINAKVAVKGENVETEITIDVEQAFYGSNKKIQLRAIDGKMKTFNIKVPAGIRNGEKIRLIGQGKRGQNGGKTGDLFIKVNIENTKQYRLHGYDIYTDLWLAPWEAVLGTRVTIDTIDDTANVYIPQGIRSGEKIRIKQKGYKDGKGGRGDLIAEIKIIVPKNPSEEELELYQKIKEITKFEPRKQQT